MYYLSIKIISKAKEEGVDWNTISDKYINSFFNDISLLNILPANSYPRATHYIHHIHTFINQLISTGKAYSLDGNVLFNLDESTQYKAFNPNVNHTNDEDFVLWKAKDNEPIWDSQWGKGRPGWHIECSSMIQNCFNGKTLDIHVGGVDLKFPHHHNEILQSQSLTNKPLCNQ